LFIQELNSYSVPSSSQIISLEDIEDVVVNEGLVGFKIIFYILIIIKSDAFRNLNFLNKTSNNTKEKNLSSEMEGLKSISFSDSLSFFPTNDLANKRIFFSSNDELSNCLNIYSNSSSKLSYTQSTYIATTNNNKKLYDNNSKVNDFEFNNENDDSSYEDLENDESECDYEMFNWGNLNMIPVVNRKNCTSLQEKSSFEEVALFPFRVIFAS
jgi:hypothetical protein